MNVKIKIISEERGIAMEQEFSYGRELSLIELSNLSGMILKNIQAFEKLMNPAMPVLVRSVEP